LCTSSSGAPDFQPRNPEDHQFYRIIDIRNPTKPVEAGRWWYPGQREGDPEPPMPRHPTFDSGCRPHNINVYPQRPDRAYVSVRGRSRAGFSRRPLHRRPLHP
jgi:hypothetical protein